MLIFIIFISWPLGFCIHYLLLIFCRSCCVLCTINYDLYALMIVGISDVFWELYCQIASTRLDLHVFCGIVFPRESHLLRIFAILHSLYIVSQYWNHPRTFSSNDINLHNHFKYSWGTFLPNVYTFNIILISLSNCLNPTTIRCF